MRQLPSSDEMRAFLREYKLHSRFEGRDGDVWGRGYSQLIVDSALEHLDKYGVGFIDVYEAASGRTIKYDRTLTILNPDEPRAQLGKKAPNLTHIYGQSF